MHIPSTPCLLYIDMFLKNVHQTSMKGMDSDVGSCILGGVERFDMPLTKDVLSLTARIDCAW